MFPTIGFCATQILKIVGSQVELERIYLLVGILISLKKCHLQSKKLNKLIFESKN
jgi:hypothetical protein